ncbi:ubiquitin-conjugating enzyme family protein [Entamoeba histolytica HM-1:IMSS-B]|uniref:Ubiquitin-conjugating enzyme family protein n=6 Tax=Entamoeba histolytica TaxID=5759 RepID=C4M0U2_ENTH1|nr:ubiquitin-conjugating enzyme family protein [Entamoeba histolytica HM-1:IMSS]EMD45529.1 ubiquitinconjugating enzyme family protein [Entamoeba histolytica KU27]EMH78033.1 ubiquitin-conjugating enzyme family protein [Entamoeba histolytica HM-1:IMSS-B]ENY59769.1 ubiquitin-conjugating enzyme family protein, putative [Entamoeba histolytica HM-1:IMSS-A]BAN37869.1 ubiquitin-conjugating enzyme family protein [Entamoeba histolytica]EAL46328.1 ubiquitin-conjugating enzyme family protein [Entamoeba hi|eukprot:XP_651714.1 ubiquitin-conjugating enzyme family protein [Entamoeba histolytica HM-1:IMSS]
MSAAKFIQSNYKSIIKDPLEGIYVEYASEDNIFEWNIWMEGPTQTPYEGGVFNLRMFFPDDFPSNPPKLVFKSEFWHPNVYPDGKVCISILHPPGEDEMSGELASERWLPTQSVSSILLSVQSMLCDPNMYSPANTDAMVQCRDHNKEYLKRCKEVSLKGRASLPSFIKIPHPDTDRIEHQKQIEKARGYDLKCSMDIDMFDDVGDGEEIIYDDDDEIN